MQPPHAFTGRVGDAETGNASASRTRVNRDCAAVQQPRHGRIFIVASALHYTQGQGQRWRGSSGITGESVARVESGLNAALEARRGGEGWRHSSGNAGARERMLRPTRHRRSPCQSRRHRRFSRCSSFLYAFRLQPSQWFSFRECVQRNETKRAWLGNTPPHLLIVKTIRFVFSAQ